MGRRFGQASMKVMPTDVLLNDIGGALGLGESPLDPVVDIVVRPIRSIMWWHRRTVQAQRVPQDWPLPYVHQLYDDVALLAAPKPEPARE